MKEQGYGAYTNTTIDTADQGKLILIVYDVAIKHCKLSLDLFGDHRKIEDRTKHLFKAQDAITELMSSLKMDVGEISRNLYRLYDYMLYCLVEANIRKDPGFVEEVLKHLESLRDAWSQAIVKIKHDALAVDESPMQKNFALVG